MIRRKKPEPPPAPKPWWQARIDAAWALMNSHGTDTLRAQNRQMLDDVVVALTEATNDRAALAGSIAGLDPDRISAELKTALRSRPDPTAPDNPMITALRQRHELVHRLQDRLEDLDARIERTLIDVDTLAGRSVEVALAAAPNETITSEIDRLNADLEALTQAHDEISHL